MTHTALITGASSGIGYELAKLFARDRHNLVLVARSGAKLTQFAGELERQFGVSATTISLDLTSLSAPQVLFDQLHSRGIVPHFLVNNAGYGVLGEFSQVSLEECLGQIQLNITALTEITRVFLPQMIHQGSGKILNVASTAGFQPGPRMAVYYATKAYVISLSEALASELRGSGITVTCLCPGPTDTGFQKRARTEDSVLLKRLQPMSAKAVAQDGYRGLMSGRTLVISGLRNWLVAESTRFAPRRIVTAISRKLLQQA